jgi:hypothetical protein
LVVTTAVKFPTALGGVVIETVNAVAVAAVTVPAAPLLKTRELLPAVVSKPYPFIVSVLPVISTLVELLVITGFTVATCTAEPLLTPLVVTIAVKLPAVVGDVERLTVSVVAVAAETVPTAPLLNAMVLFPAVESKPIPFNVRVVPLAAKE